MTGFAMRRLLCVVLFASACGPIAGLAGKEKVAYLSETASVFDRAPASAYRLQNPYDGQPNAVLAGRKLFLRHCAQCHGEKAEGDGWCSVLVPEERQSAGGHAIVVRPAAGAAVADCQLSQEVAIRRAAYLQADYFWTQKVRCVPEARKSR